MSWTTETSASADWTVQRDADLRGLTYATAQKRYATYGAYSYAEPGTVYWERTAAEGDTWA